MKAARWRESGQHYRKPRVGRKLLRVTAFFVAPVQALRQKRSPRFPPAFLPEQRMDPTAIETAAIHLMLPYIDLIKAAVLGVVEGFTEFLPVSSTGHLLLMEHFLGWGDDSFGKSFAILIQLGAILALLSIYFGRIW
jgi:Bacitracin resistance protein BacA